MKTHRTTWGTYVTTDGRFEIQKAIDSDDRQYGWHLFQLDTNGDREWWNTFATKTDALAAASRN